QLHLNRPVVDQYWSWLSGVLRGDFGTSLVSLGQEPVTNLLSDRIVNSTFLVGLSALVAFPISILIGAICAYRRDKLFDHLNSSISVALASLPDFAIALTLVLLLSTTVFHFFPAVALIEPGTPVWEQMDQLVLPVMTLVIYETPYVSRIMRASMVE